MIVDDPDFIRWLSNLVRRDDWNGTMRTPARWREMYDAGLTCAEAAVAPHNWRKEARTAAKTPSGVFNPRQNRLTLFSGLYFRLLNGAGLVAHSAEVYDRPVCRAAICVSHVPRTRRFAGFQFVSQLGLKPFRVFDHVGVNGAARRFLRAGA